jgi:hypothetical protein
VVTETGQVAAAITIFPHEPQRRWDESIVQLARLAVEHRVELIAIGKGTASRETDRLGAELIRRHPELKLTKVVVSEAGASVYLPKAQLRATETEVSFAETPTGSLLPPSHVPSHPQNAAKVRGFSRTASAFTAETDCLLEGTGFEPSVPPDRCRRHINRPQAPDLSGPDIA